MARRKRTSPSVESAKGRANGLKSIDAALDLGNELTLAAFDAAIKAVEKDLDDYNQLLSDLDGQLTELESAESTLDELSSRMLAGVRIKFGKDSTQYQQAGGTRTSERKTPLRKSKPLAVAA